MLLTTYSSLFDYGIDVNYFHRIFNRRRTIPETNYLGHWRRYPDADTEKKPHHMVVISIGLEKEEKLLQQEILVILAAMKGRLQDARLKKHVVFPVSEKGLYVRIYGLISSVRSCSFRFLASMGVSSRPTTMDKILSFRRAD